MKAEQHADNSAMQDHGASRKLSECSGILLAALEAAERERVERLIMARLRTSTLRPVIAAEAIG